MRFVPGPNRSVLDVDAAVTAKVELMVRATLAASVDDGRIVTVSDTAHYPNMEEPGEFNAAIREFVERIL